MGIVTGALRAIVNKSTSKYTIILRNCKFRQLSLDVNKTSITSLKLHNVKSIYSLRQILMLVSTMFCKYTP